MDTAAHFLISPEGLSELVALDPFPHPREAKASLIALILSVLQRFVPPVQTAGVFETHRCKAGSCQSPRSVRMQGTAESKSLWSAAACRRFERARLLARRERGAGPETNLCHG